MGQLSLWRDKALPFFNERITKCAENLQDWCKVNTEQLEIKKSQPVCFSFHLQFYSSNSFRFTRFPKQEWCVLVSLYHFRFKGVAGILNLDIYAIEEIKK